MGEAAVDEGQGTEQPRGSKNPERHEFAAEVGRLLDLVVHSLYSEREIFLRELVANAADAIDRRRFLALTDPAMALPEEASGSAKVRILPDKPGRRLTIEDDGIGMSREELASQLGTIARSGTRAFGEELAAAKPEERPSLIGQFGVGFYSAFMVAERVEVVSRRPDATEAWLWSSDGSGFSLSPAARENPGTSVTLFLKPDAEEFLDPVALETVVRKWADHITVPITIARDGKDLPANEGTALWRKPRGEISEQSYHGFYRHLGHLFDTPAAIIHWHAEGSLEFSALLFIPGSRPLDLFEQDRHAHVRLHVRRMFITDQADLLPSWLRFVQGVVDTEDLPLNVSREILQATPVVARIRKALVNRVLNELKTRAKEAGEYEKIWENFGPVLKEGVWEDEESRREIAPLLRFRSSASDSAPGGPAPGLVSLADYVARKQPGQEAIYILRGDDPAQLAHSPQLEGFRARKLEVLLLADPIDAFWPDRLGEYEGMPIRSITQAATDLEKFPLEGEEAPGSDTELLVARLKSALEDAVSAVRPTARLVESAVALAAADRGPDLHLQRLMRRSGRPMPTAAPVLEINPRHPLIRALAATKGTLGEEAALLLDLARVQEGDPPADPTRFAQRVATALAGALARTATAAGSAA
ncbi:MAG TPA: molecular chaperone HtpG [Acetobacteraceae bacterium]|jgi:molecular chaperone HtpG|nr:molecular chaperone HtpG [Acetobacteraceae bacterium]